MFFLQNKSTFIIPSKETVELLAQNSGGDIRTAINGLQFSCLKGESGRNEKYPSITGCNKMFHNCLNMFKTLTVVSCTIVNAYKHSSNFFSIFFWFIIIILCFYTVVDHGSKIYYFTVKSYTSKRKFNLARKDESKPKKSKSRITKGEKQINSLCDSGEASYSSQTSQCLVYRKETDYNLMSETVTAIGGRDTALFLFRALGKILYCKSE